MATRLDPFVDPTRWMDQILGTVREAAGPQVPTMPIDLYRAGDHYVMHVDIPGADPGSVDVNVEDRTLTIRAERTGRTDADAQWLARERGTGTYVRQLTVGRGLALDRVEAAYADGVLTLTIPVAEEAKPRRIEIQHASAGTPLGSGEHRQVEQSQAG
ncbi:Hsp20/alpha crystallin family protein [Actinotalea solisilvae]|uniref:Hsp20/alpha crystallin family protein n=1 Tax=Actinotalea solisilvae TaxID=2072922 RepID=UPI0035587559